MLKKNTIVGAFLAMPMAVLNCPKYRSLSPSAVKLLFDIASQYNGKNNGDLNAAFKVMKPKGWKSETTLTKARKELQETGFIAETRKGRLPNLCTLYGITWQPLDPSPKLDIGPNGFPLNAWAELPREEAGKNASLTPVSVVALRRIAPETGVGNTPIAPETVGMGLKMGAL